MRVWPRSPDVDPSRETPEAPRRGVVLCPNCDAPFTDRYCAVCGQDSVDPPRGARALAGWFAARAVGADARGPRSLRALLFEPGRLTQDWSEGRRARWSGPIQVYLWATAFFFGVHAIRPFVWLQVDPVGRAHRFFGSLGAAEVGFEFPASALAALTAAGSSMAEFQLRFDAAAAAYLPVLLVGLVVATTLVLALLTLSADWLRHTVFALHWTALYFVWEGVRRLLGFPSELMGLVLVGNLLVAFRRVYGSGWVGGGLRALLLVITFALLLALWVSSTISLAIRLAGG